MVIFKKNGFSLIEILVVLTIIGILSTFLLANFSESKKKANEAAIIKILESVRGLAAAHLDENGKFPITLCSTNGELWSVMAELKSRTNDLPVGCLVGSTRTSWALAIYVSSAKKMCADSSGIIKDIPLAGPGTVIQPGMGIVRCI